MILFWDYFREFWKCLFMYALFNLALCNFYAQGADVFQSFSISLFSAQKLSTPFNLKDFLIE